MLMCTVTEAGLESGLKLNELDINVCVTSSCDRGSCKAAVS